MNQEEFHKAYEKHSVNEFEKFIQLSEDQLLKLIDKKEFGDNYQIWRAVAVKGTEKSIPIIYDFVSDLENDYLKRYHATIALFKLASIDDEDFLGQVQYGRNSKRKRVNQIKAIQELKKRLEKYFNEEEI